MQNFSLHVTGPVPKKFDTDFAQILFDSYLCFKSQYDFLSKILYN